MISPLHITRVRIRPGPDRADRTVTVAGGRIVALDGTAPAGATPLDGGGRTLVPGLIDAHLHLLMGGLALARLDLSGVSSRAAFEAAIASRHATLPAGAWLVAAGWQESRWGSELPDRTWLAAAGDRPCVAYRADLHAAVVNDAVLARCVGARESPPGGEIVRDPSTGAATGVLREAALWQLVNPHVPAPAIETQRDALLAAQAHGHAHGLTAVGTMEYVRDLDAVYRPLRDRLTLRCRVTLLDRAWPMAFDLARDLRGGGDLAVIGYKAFVDGTLGSRTARLLEPYADDPDTRGLLVELAESGDLAAWACACTSAGQSPSFHAIGDDAVRRVLDVLDELPAPGAGALPPRIEHAQQIAASDIPRFRGRIASMQPLHRADDALIAEARLGATRLAGTFPFRSLADAGAVLAFGSDWPVVPLDPVAGMRAAITGLDRDGRPFRPDEVLTPEEALAAYTTNAARTLGLSTGAIAVGAPADLTLLDADPFDCDWISAPPRVTVTIAQGRIAWSREDEATGSNQE